MSDNINHALILAKSIGVGFSTFFVGTWTWLGESNTELGGLASLVGMSYIIYKVALEKNDS